MNDIKEIIYDSMTEEHKGSGKLHPSSLGGCIRKAMYQNKGFKETHPMPDWKKWQLARYGWYEQPIIKALGGWDQFPVENARWKGRVDLFTNNTLIEVKSFGSSTRVMDLPRHYHKLQVWCYWILAEEDGHNLDTAHIAYIERWADKHRKKPRIYIYGVTPTELDLTETTDLMNEMEKWQEKDTLPPRPYETPETHKWDCVRKTYNFPNKRTEWEVQCPFFVHCWPDRVDDYNEFVADILPF